MQSTVRCRSGSRSTRIVNGGGSGTDGSGRKATVCNGRQAFIARKRDHRHGIAAAEPVDAYITDNDTCHRLHRTVQIAAHVPKLHHGVLHHIFSFVAYVLPCRAYKARAQHCGFFHIFAVRHRQWLCVSAVRPVRFNICSDRCSSPLRLPSLLFSHRRPCPLSLWPTCRCGQRSICCNPLRCSYSSLRCWKCPPGRPCM